MPPRRSPPLELEVECVFDGRLTSIPLAVPDIFRQDSLLRATIDSVFSAARSRGTLRLFRQQPSFRVVRKERYETCKQVGPRDTRLFGGLHPIRG